MNPQSTVNSATSVNVNSDKMADTTAPLTDQKEGGLSNGKAKGMAKQDEGKFLSLPNAEMGKVVVRFPPEASGYLHIGHAKAAMLNYIYAQEYNGKLLFRFDDTNPNKEKEHFEEVIKEDIELLGIKYDALSYSSDHFEYMLELAEKMIKDGKAYVDDTPVEKMREERAACVESASRSNSVEENLRLWAEMKAGSEKGQQCALRAKINMKHANGCMRDPVLYRCNPLPHLRTGDKYKAYPTYDFCCPIVDSKEGVTHALRTNEYRDRQEQYEWLCSAMDLRCPVVYDYSRLNMAYTVMSKRKLTWFVEQGLVYGWDDPRFPTVRGIIRRGLTVEGLKQFILAQGASRSNNLMEWDKIWAFNKKIIDPQAKRFTALDKTGAVPVTLTGVPDTPASVDIPYHKKNPDLGTRTVYRASSILLEGDDAAGLQLEEEVTLMDWGNAIVKKIEKDGDAVKALEMELHLEGDFRKTKKKLTWLADMKENVACVGVEFDHLITKAKLDDGDKLEDYLNPKTEFKTELIGEPALKELAKGDIIQLQRRGFFIVDQLENSNGQLTLFNVPDGRQKHMSTLSTKAMPAAARREHSTPPAQTNTGDVSEKNTVDTSDVEKRIAQQGDKIRELKANKADAETIGAEVKALLALKAEYKEATGKEWAAPNARPKSSKASKADQSKSAPPTEKSSTGKGRAAKKAAKEAGKKDSGKLVGGKGGKEGGRTKLGMQASKENDFNEWYTELLQKAELIEYHDISGCYVYRPASYSIWEFLQAYLDKRIKSIGVQNCYFPMFVTQKALQNEKDHIADFAPEVAWVTKAGNSEMSEPVAIRPTSETVMYPYFSKWVQSHRDLPILLNQWCNVVRWEFKHPQPFLRTREFLWQEGHTAHSNREDAEKEVLQILQFYEDAYKMLAVPVVKGKKTEKEKFAGALFTTTLEAYIPGSGRAIQAATSHCLGQNFSKMFDIAFQDPNDPTKRLNVWQNSWGFTTRSIGVMIMVHGDDKGMVLPPKVASVQVIIIPCGLNAAASEEDRKKLHDHVSQLANQLRAADIRADADLRDNYTTGWKFNHWEQRGVPLRLEVGPKDIQAQQVMMIRRDTGERMAVPAADVDARVAEMLNEVQDSLFARATEKTKRHTVEVNEWADFIPALEKKCLCLVPFCERTPCEDQIKKRSTSVEEVTPGAPAMGAKALCIPFDQPHGIEGKMCVQCGSPAVSYTLFGRSY